MNIRVGVPMRVPETIDAIRKLVELNSTLRTGIFADQDGVAYQYLAGSGTIPVEVLEFPCSPGYLAVIESLPQVSMERPVGIVIAAVAELVEYVAVRLNHVVTDAWGFMRLKQQLESELHGNDGRVTASTPAGDKSRCAGNSSVDRADFESSDSGNELRRRALEYAADQLRRCPQTMFPHRRLAPESPRYWNVELHSKALFAALGSLTAGTRMMLSTPIVGAFATIMSLHASLATALVYVGSSNRFSRDWKDFTGPLFQEAIICIPIPRTTLRSLFTELNGRIPRMYRYARCDPAALREQIREVELARGICLDKVAASAMVNIVSDPVHIEAPRSSPQKLHMLAQSSKITRSPRAVVDNLTFFLDVFINAPEVLLACRVDTEIVSLSEAEAILRGLEKLLCTVVGDDIPTDQIAVLCPGISRRADDATVEVDHCRISLADCRAAVNAIPAVRDSFMRLDERGETPALTAYVHVADRDLTVARLRRAVVAELAPHGRAMAAHHYRLYGSRPAVFDDVSGWDRAELISAGCGRGTIRIRAATQ